MAWEMLPTNYKDAVWTGLKKYNQVNNTDGTVSLQDVTAYTNKEKSFFGAMDANKMNEALNTIMSMVESGTDLYEAFETYFDTQKLLFEGKENSEYNEFVDYTNKLKAEGDGVITTIKTDYKNEIDSYEYTQSQVFATWFEMMKNQLSKDVAGNLQNQCTEIDDRLSSLEHMTLQNKFSVPLAIEGDTLTLFVDDTGKAIVADWKYKEV